MQGKFWIYNSPFPTISDKDFLRVGNKIRKFDLTVQKAVSSDAHATDKFIIQKHNTALVYFETMI